MNAQHALTIRPDTEPDKPKRRKRAQILFSMRIWDGLKMLKMERAESLGHTIQARWNKRTRRVEIVALGLLLAAVTSCGESTAPAPSPDVQVQAAVDGLNVAMRALWRSGKRGLVTGITIDTSIAPVFVYLPRR